MYKEDKLNKRNNLHYQSHMGGPLDILKDRGNSSEIFNYMKYMKE